MVYMLYMFNACSKNAVKNIIILSMNFYYVNGNYYVMASVERKLGSKETMYYRRAGARKYWATPFCSKIVFCRHFNMSDNFVHVQLCGESRYIL